MEIFSKITKIKCNSSNWRFVIQSLNECILYTVYISDQTTDHILIGANITKISLKSWQFCKKSYWDFLFEVAMFKSKISSLSNLPRPLVITLVIKNKFPTKEHIRIGENITKIWIKSWVLVCTSHWKLSWKYNKIKINKNI